MERVNGMGTFTQLFLLVFYVHGSFGLVHDNISIQQLSLCGNKQLPTKINTAILVIRNELATNLTYFEQSEECYKCDLQPVTLIGSQSICQLHVDSRWKVRYKLQESSGTSCSVTRYFKESGIYNISLSNGTDIVCFALLTNNPSDSNLPIYITLAVIIFVIILIKSILYFKRTFLFRRIVSRFSQENLIEADLGSPDGINPTDDSDSIRGRMFVKERLKSLDTFRGISIVIMIFVNYGGGQYWFFKHSPWNGLTVADLVFPWFIFIMGTSMAYSFRSMLRKDLKKRTIMKKIIWRTLVLFFFGILINCSTVRGIDLTEIRIPGVLQRFAVTYFIVGVTHMFTARAADHHQFVWWTPIQDIVVYWLDWVVSLILLTIYLCITFGLKVPNCPLGYLGPGGLANKSGHPMCTGGASGYIDRQVFTDKHMYQHGTFKAIYKSEVSYDPEGLLGCLSTCLLCTLGLQAGKIFLMFRMNVDRLKRFLIWAVILGGIAVLLTKASKDGGWIPINKNLWSLSYVCAMGGMSFFLLALCYLIIDVWKIWSGLPFYCAGMNAITLYMGHELFSRKFPVYWHANDTHTDQLLLNLWGTAFWVIIAAYMHYKEVYFTI